MTFLRKSKQLNLQSLTSRVSRPVHRRGMQIQPSSHGIFWNGKFLYISGMTACTRLKSCRGKSTQLHWNHCHHTVIYWARILGTKTEICVPHSTVSAPTASRGGLCFHQIPPLKGLLVAWLNKKFNKINKNKIK